MSKLFKSIGAFMIASAIIWGAVILGCSYALKGTACYEKIQNILVGGVMGHIILLWGPLALMISKHQKKQKK